ncbi:MAG: glycosyltransferase family 4 protein [Geminicoccaceae bacterium]|nr:glycosyltransferase family 4 protein [Geminicoccaceae bacterium]
MRILFCNYEYPPLGGGGGIVTALLAESLAARRHEVTVLTSRGLGLPSEDLREGVRVIRVPVLFRQSQATANLASMFAYMARAPFDARRWFAPGEFDLVNTHFVLPSGPAGQSIARSFGVPNVLSLHGGDLYDPSKPISPHRHLLLRLWVRHLLHQADHLIGQSVDTIANVHRYYDPQLAVSRISLSIHRPAAAEGVRSDYGFAPEDRLLVTVGRLVARKAIEQLVAILTLLPPTTRLLIVGNGPKEAEIRRQASEAGVAERVHFLGFVSEREKFEILHMADLFVSTSQHEGFGLVFLEAMACGLPVVCYDRGGQNDFLMSGVTGTVVPLNDRAGFAAAVADLLTDPERCRMMGEHNRERVEPYLADNCVRQYETVFEQVLSAHRRRLSGARLPSTVDELGRHVVR